MENNVTSHITVFEASEASFNETVLQNSLTKPVIVAFINIWSEPCITLSDLFSKLALEFNGLFLFVKVDIDEQPGLREKFNIENVPTLITFKQTEIISTEVGVLQENEARTLLKNLGIFHQSDEKRQQAREKHLAGQTADAIMLLSQAIKSDPKNTRVAMDMVQIFIDIQNYDDARKLFNVLPDVDKNSDMGKSLIGQLTFMELAEKTQGIEVLNQKLKTDSSDHHARFDLSVCLVARHQYEDALNHLFTIL